ncbi:MAG: hypothetical protein CMF96_01775 [Candidatus Marinimicrobia bacterium]|nr:hypothetical protein [Candidatus Neomarinimicrobiota bacterium]
MNKTLENSLMRLLAMGNLIEPLAKLQGELRFVNEYNFGNQNVDIPDEKAIQGLMNELKIKDRKDLIKWQRINLLATDALTLSEYAQFRYKRRCIIEKLIEGNGEALFLRYKDRLDRVLYSLIRVADEDLAHHIYYSIESNEIEFGDASSKYSDGPESKTQGIIGPCDLSVPHPDISSRLRNASPKQLFKPFAIDKWFAILRLEYRFDSEFNESTKLILGSMLLSSKVRNISSEIYKESINQFTDK